VEGKLAVMKSRFVILSRAKNDGKTIGRKQGDKKKQKRQQLTYE